MADQLGIAIVCYTASSIISAGLVRYFRINLRAERELNQIIPLSSRLNTINFAKQNSTTWTVKSIDGRKLLELKRFNNHWHLESVQHKILATIKNGFRDRYIVRHRLDIVDERAVQNAAVPFNTTPNIIKWNPSYGFKGQAGYHLEYQFGTTLNLRWVGEDYLEIVRKNRNSSRDGGIRVHERVALVRGYDQSSGYTLLFDHDKINLEILIATFFLTIKARHYI